MNLKSKSLAGGMFASTVHVFNSPMAGVLVVTIVASRAKFGVSAISNYLVMIKFVKGTHGFGTETT